GISEEQRVLARTCDDVLPYMPEGLSRQPELHLPIRQARIGNVHTDREFRIHGCGIIDPSVVHLMQRKSEAKQVPSLTQAGRATYGPDRVRVRREGVSSRRYLDTHHGLALTLTRRMEVLRHHEGVGIGRRRRIRRRSRVEAEIARVG